MKEIDNLIEALKLLPSIGEKTAERLAFAVLKMPNNKTTEIIEAIKNAKEKIKQCPICGLYTTNDICDICANKKRDKNTIMVLSYAKDVYIFENNKDLNYNGVYHIINGLINDNTNINTLNINTLIKKVKEQNAIKEIILAFDPIIEGELTAKYIANLISKINSNILITRIAYGLPVGGNIEFVDNFTISEAIKGRKKIKCS